MSRKVDRSMARGGFALCCAAALATGAGCSGYRLGSMLPANIRTVHISPIPNKTGEPLIDVEARRALVLRLQRDGALRAIDEESADSILSVSLDSFEAQSIAYDRSDSTRPDEYRLYLSASYVLTETRTGKVLSESAKVTGEATFVMVGDMTTSRQTAIPTAADDLARRLVSRIVETW